MYVPLSIFQDCFKQNFIDGRRLIYFRSVSAFPKIGITDFTDMKAISAAIRRLLRVDKPKFYQYQDYASTKSIALPEEIAYTMYLQVNLLNQCIVPFWCKNLLIQLYVLNSIIVLQHTIQHIYDIITVGTFATLQDKNIHGI
mgnify:CR=1 FL=1